MSEPSQEEELGKEARDGFAGYMGFFTDSYIIGHWEEWLTACAESEGS